MKFSKLLGVLAIVAAGFILIGPWTFAYACRDMRDSTALCHTTRWYSMAVGLVIMACGVLLMRVNSYVFAKILTLIMLVAGAVEILLPLVIAPVCKTLSMHCRTVMVPFMMGIGAAVAAVSLLFLIKGARKVSREEAEAKKDQEEAKAAEEVAEWVEEASEESTPHLEA